MADRAEGGPLLFEPFDRRASAAPHRVDVTELVTVSNPFDYHTFMWGDRAAIAEVLHRGHGRPAGRDDAGARCSAEPRQRRRRRGTPRPTRWPTRPRARADAPWSSRRWPSASTKACARTSPTRGLTPLLGLTEGLAALGGRSGRGHALRCRARRRQPSPSSTRLRRRGAGEVQARCARCRRACRRRCRSRRRRSGRSRASAIRSR